MNTTEQNFKPYLCAMFDDEKPQSIVIGAICNEKRFIYFDDLFTNLSYEKKSKKIKKEIKLHIKTQGGNISGFGKIKYYILRILYNCTKEDLIIFDTKGNIIEDFPDENKIFNTNSSLYSK